MSRCDFAQWLHDARAVRNIGLRELSRALSSSDGPISSTHLSRLENDQSGYDCSKLQADKLWALSIFFSVHPGVLFLMSRGVEPPCEDVNGFAFREFPFRSLDAWVPLGQLMKSRRRDLGLTATAAIRNACHNRYSFGWSVTGGYWSQLENGHEDRQETVSAESLWLIGLGLQTAPALLFVLSRHLSDFYLQCDNRQRSFGCAVAGALSTDAPSWFSVDWFQGRFGFNLQDISCHA